MQFCALYYFAGFPGIVWGGAMRICWVYHNTWTVNSVAHVWGSQTYNTGEGREACTACSEPGVHV